MGMYVGLEGVADDGTAVGMGEGLEVAVDNSPINLFVRLVKGGLGASTIHLGTNVR